ncbi:hypothetical protein AKJ09_05481 [Labilithrix luteola]|uniref:Uncharacterized protein n=1 Tax=Labilithrix luteola TaxID=1391654 RepID=A0A0K1PZ99_9BACT|nr:hypothetical protein AKJ09_05481 [Labilithrix luteola]
MGFFRIPPRRDQRRIRPGGDSGSNHASHEGPAVQSAGHFSGCGPAHASERVQSSTMPALLLANDRDRGVA